MKMVMIAIALMGLAGASTQSVLVRNKPVDLAPVIRWLEKREGERPMPHWKVLEIEKLLGKGWGGYQVNALVDGKRHESLIVLQNVPATVLEMIAADDAALKAMADLEARMEALDRQRQEWERQKELTVRELSYAYEVALVQLRANEEAMAELRTAYAQQSERLRFASEARKSKMLAHFTGQKVGKYEVWDCGVGAKVLAGEGLRQE